MMSQANPMKSESDKQTAGDSSSNSSTQEHQKTEAFSKRLSGNLTIVAVVIVVLFGIQSIKSGPSTSDQQYMYADNSKFKLSHPVPSDKCLTVSDHGTVSHTKNPDSTYNEIVIVHTTKLVCKPDLKWDEERSKMQFSK